VPKCRGVQVLVVIVELYPFSLSDIFTRRVKDKYPDFINQITKHGVKYSSLIGQHPDPDPSKGVGRGWDTFFGKQCNSKDEVEARMLELGYTWEWVNADGLLKTTTPVLSATRKAPRSGRDIFFNQIPAMIANAKVHIKQYTLAHTCTHEAVHNQCSYSAGVHQRARRRPLPG
jgi:hypothetical protein